MVSCKNKKYGTINHTPRSPSWVKDFAERLLGVWFFFFFYCRRGVNHPSSAINLFLLQTLMFWYHLASLCTGHRDLRWVTVIFQGSEYLYNNLSISQWDHELRIQHLYSKFYDLHLDFSSYDLCAANRWLPACFFF